MTGSSVSTDADGRSLAPPTPIAAAAPAPSTAPATVRPSPIAVPLGLAWTLIRTDFKTRYHGTLGGFFWALLKPMAMFAVLMIVFSYLFPDPTYKLNLIVGLFLWDFFAEGTKVGLTSLHARGFLVAKAPCPSWILVITSLSNPALTLGVCYAVIILFLSATAQAPGIMAVGLTVAYAAALAMMVIGISLAGSVLFLRYRDLNQVWDVVIQAGFFLAPVIYPLSIIPERFHRYLYLWPPTAVIEFARAVLVRHVVPTGTAHLCLAIDALVILGAGAGIFRLGAPRSAEYL